jgi:hypothetical protein
MLKKDGIVVPGEVVTILWDCTGQLGSVGTKLLKFADEDDPYTN